jgi:hypothetical protein
VVPIRSSAVVAGAAAALAVAAVAVAVSDGGDRGTPAAAGTVTRVAAPPSSALDAEALDPTAAASTGPRPALAGARSHDFTVALDTDAGPIRAHVVPIDVASGQPVQPPEGTAAQWNTAVWVRASAFPAARTPGTTYVYGHACRHHVCPFTRIERRAGGAFTVHSGDSIVVTTATARLDYTVMRVAAVPKDAGTLPAWVGYGSVPNRLVLVTCEYEDGEQSLNNIVVVARLDHGTGSTSAR